MSADAFSFELTIPVLWGDMDALGHVNNTRYFTWFEAARIGYFGKLAAMGAKLEDGVGPILATTTCDYLRPVAFPGDVKVGARVSEVGNSSLRMAYAIARTDAPEILCARGTGVVVLVRYATLEKVRVPDSARAAISSLERL